MVGGVIEEEKDEAGLHVKFVRLGDGRRICYQESGVHGSEAERQLLVLHGLGSSRLAGIPGVSPALLLAYRVRLIAIDRPGYGRSDVHHRQTLKSTVKDIEDVADALQMGAKFFLLGYSGGGVSCWACARYIPHRIAGIVGWAPLGCFYWKGITKKDRQLWWDDCARYTRLLFGVVGRNLPHCLLRFCTKYLVRPGPGFLKKLKRTVSKPDREHLKVKAYATDGTLEQRGYESSSRSKGYGMYMDIVVWNRDWGFELEDVAKVYKGKVHIWQGTEDSLVPIGLQRWIKDQVPDLVDLHELPNEGHLSWFCYNDHAHRQVFETVFGETLSINLKQDSEAQLQN